MALFTQKPDDPGPWASLPGEPLEQDGVDKLDDGVFVDPLDIGLGAQTTSIVFPVAPVLEDAAEQADAEPEEPAEP